MRNFLCFIACIALMGGAHAQILWGSTEYGMSLQQAKNAVVDGVDMVDGDTLRTGAVEKLRVRGIQLAGHEFHAGLFFRDDRLEQVSLRLSEELATGAANHVTDRLVAALRAKYGQEISKKETGGILLSRDYTWISGKTNISLLMAAIGEKAQVLNISYQVRIMKDAEQL